MVKVFSIGRRQIVTDPQTKKETEGRIITFTEEGRGGGNSAMDESNQALSQALGKKVGLPTRRTHTQFLSNDDLQGIEIGQELNMFINRVLTSIPQMEQQRNVMPRMIGGKLTYFGTKLGTVPKDDEDMRESLATIAAINPGLASFTQLRTANVKVIEEPVEVVDKIVENPVNEEHVDLKA